MTPADHSTWSNLAADMGPAERHALSRREPMSVFAVISWGCAATGWVARVLNSHPDIFCMHAANVFWQKYGYPESERLDGVAYLRVVFTMANSYLAAGDVHGISRHHVPAIRDAFGDHFRCAVLVRDPLPRIRSQLALFEAFRQFPAWDLEYIKETIDRHGIILPSEDPQDAMFVHAANMLNAIVEEQELGAVFRSEDITSSPDALADFINVLTNGKVCLDRDWLEQAVRQPRVSQHADDNSEWELDPWQFDALRKVVWPEAWEAYEKLGYANPLR